MVELSGGKHFIWKIFDTLIDSVDDSVRIRDFTVGTYWTAVMTDDGSLGLAPSIHERYQRFEFSTEPRQGMLLSDMAAGLKSWNYAEASLALAAVNAFFNRSDRIPADAEIHPGGRRSRGAFLKFCESNTKDRHTLFSEPMYERDELRSAPGIIDIIRRNTDRTYRDYPYTAYRKLIPDCDQVVVGGTSFVDKISGPVLERAFECGVFSVLWGMDIPLCTALFEENIDQITGFIADDPETCLRLVKRAATREDIIRFGHFVTINK